VSLPRRPPTHGPRSAPPGGREVGRPPDQLKRHPGNWTSDETGRELPGRNWRTSRAIRNIKGTPRLLRVLAERAGGRGNQQLSGKTRVRPRREELSRSPGRSAPDRNGRGPQQGAQAAKSGGTTQARRAGENCAGDGGTGESPAESPNCASRRQCRAPPRLKRQSDGKNARTGDGRARNARRRRSRRGTGAARARASVFSRHTCETGKKPGGIAQLHQSLPSSRKSGEEAGRCGRISKR